jgi:ABC-type Fe3+/spermidine/putrescine transport system ATPase subunit
MNAIQIIELVKKFNGQQVLKGFSMDIPEGSLIHISGRSGSGKTTLLRCIAGLEKFDSGELYLFDKIAQNKELFLPPSKRKIGMVFQDLVLFPHMTVFQNVDFVSKAILKNRDQRTRWNQGVLQKMRIGHKQDKYPHELSGGEKQRVAIARAIAHRPKILLLDEPFSHLDEELRNDILWDLLKFIRSENLTCIIASHQNTGFEQSDFFGYQLVNGVIIT